MFNMLDSNGKAKMFGLLGLMAVGALSLTACQNAVQSDPNDPIVCKVTDKDRSTDSEGKSVFRVYTEGGEKCTTFGLADNWLLGNFNSADMYGEIKVGETYNFDTVGVRNGFLSLFPEIVSFEKTA